MTVSGLLSGLFDPRGTGFALSRAAQSQLAPVQPLEPAAPTRRAAGTPLPQASPAPFDTQDTVELSPAAQRAVEPDPRTATEPTEPDAESASRAPGRAPEQPSSPSEQPDPDDGAAGLTDEEREQVAELQQRDREVRRHEQAHLASAGGHALGGPTYDYQRGPDGSRYAVGGEVQIDTSPVKNDPQATIAKMQVVRAAALAPAEPSAQDRSIAAQATQQMQQAQAELNRQRVEGGEAEAEPWRTAAGDARDAAPGRTAPRAAASSQRGAADRHSAPDEATDQRLGRAGRAVKRGLDAAYADRHSSAMDLYA